MKTAEVLQAWAKILHGDRPSLSIEITRECPLRCPGCYAYEAGHLGGGITLRELTDRKGQALIDGVLEIADRPASGISSDLLMDVSLTANRLSPFRSPCQGFRG